MKIPGTSVDLECVVGDIARQPDVVCIVNAANAQLAPGGGVAGAIHRAAGHALYEECRPLAPIAPGEAVLTNAHSLPNRYVIHCLGPVYGQDEPSAELLARCHTNALRLADQKRARSIAFPAISTGAFGYPIDQAAAVALAALVGAAPSLEHVKLVRFVLYNERQLAPYQAELDGLASGAA